MSEVAPIYPMVPAGDTELDDAIEQILACYISDSLWCLDARNRICAEIAARGFNVYARRSDPGYLAEMSPPP